MNKNIVNKGDLIKKIAEETQIPKTKVQEVIDSAIAITKDTLSNQGVVSIFGLGNFTVKQRAAHSGINPRTKEKISIPSTNTVHFAPASSVKNAVNGK